MSLNYKLANIFGTVYSRGDLCFTPDGNCVLSPVGNRVSCFDLVNNLSYTFAYEHRKNIVRIAINKNATLMISVDEDGRAVLVNFKKRTVLHYMNFKTAVGAIQFAPDGDHIAVAAGRLLQIWRTPRESDVQQFAPFVRHRVYAGHSANITRLEWSLDSRFVLSSSKDMTARVWSLHKEDAEAATALQGHRDTIVGAFFSHSQETVYTVSKDGAQFEWQYSDDENRWVITSKHYFEKANHAKVKCASFHAKSNLLVVGFSSGVFGLYELPNLTQLQSLSISQNEIDVVEINASGEWLCLGASKLGQLLVWEWQSESYVLRQQGHYDALNAVAYSPDGSKVVTGSDDGKIKVWDARSGFAIVTFEQHSAAVTALAFSARGNVLFSASLDGSVRAWDLLRYRNFRTFTAPSRLQFTCLAVDPSGELVCAGSLNDYDVHVWNVQSSQLVDRLAGHEGPVSALDFSSDGSLLASASWDHTMRLWSFFGRSALSEPMQLSSEALAVKFSPDAKQIAVSTMDGQLTLWDPKQALQTGEIDGRRDIVGGRHVGDRFAAANSQRSKHFTTLAYSADGSALLAGGNSRFVCMYDVENEVLLRKFTVSRNMAIDGTLDTLNSKQLTEAGPLELIDTAGENSDHEDRLDLSLPGASRGSTRAAKRPAIKTSGLVFSPTAASFGVASTEGLLIYAINAKVEFDPFELDVDITAGAAEEAAKQGDYLRALVISLRLGDRPILEQIYSLVPTNAIDITTRTLPSVYAGRLLQFAAEQGQRGGNVQRELSWLRAILQFHGQQIAAKRAELSTALRAALKFANSVRNVLNTAQENVARGDLLRFLSETETESQTREVELSF